MAAHIAKILACERTRRCTWPCQAAGSCTIAVLLPSNLHKPDDCRAASDVLAHVVRQVDGPGGGRNSGGRCYALLACWAYGPAKNRSAIQNSRRRYDSTTGD